MVVERLHGEYDGKLLFLSSIRRLWTHFKSAKVSLMFHTLMQFLPVCVAERRLSTRSDRSPSLVVCKRSTPQSLPLHPFVFRCVSLCRLMQLWLYSKMPTACSLSEFIIKQYIHIHIHRGHKHIHNCSES